MKIFPRFPLPWADGTPFLSILQPGLRYRWRWSRVHAVCLCLFCPSPISARSFNGETRCTWGRFIHQLSTVSQKTACTTRLCIVSSCWCKSGIWEGQAAILGLDCQVRVLSNRSAGRFCSLWEPYICHQQHCSEVEGKARNCQVFAFPSWCHLWRLPPPFVCSSKSWNFWVRVQGLSSATTGMTPKDSQVASAPKCAFLPPAQALQAPACWGRITSCTKLRFSYAVWHGT